MHSSFFQLGHLHIPVFGVFVALGLMAALALSQRTARYAGLNPDSVWNAGITAIVAAFVISRLLLVAFNLHSFFRYPLLLLDVPSLTSTGIFLTGLLMLVYLRWQRLALLLLLDATVPCAALLWGFLNLGYLVEGTRDGMPTRLPWGISDRMLGVVHPVEVYTLATAALLCLLLLLLLIRSRYTEGSIAGLGLVFAGATIFFIDFFRLPSELFARSLIDPAQIIGLAMVLAGGWLLYRAFRRISLQNGNDEAHAL